MSVNGFNPLAQQINQTLINPAIKKQPGTPAGETDLSMTLQGSIFSINEDSSKIGQNTPTNNSNEAPEIPMEDFLANYNLSFLDPNNIATVTTYSMPYQVVQLLENKTVPTVDITYTPEDGSCVTEHYTQNDPPQLLAKTTQSGDVITSVVYNQDGLATKTSTIEAGVTTTQVFDSAGQKVIKEIVTEQGSTTTTEFDENGNSLGSKQVKGAETYEYSPGGTLVKKTLDKGQGLIYETTYSQNAEGQTVETTKDPIGGVAVTTKNTNGKSLEQTVTTDDGKSYSVKYDGNGNTKIAVQNGETMATIAKKFECSCEDLKSVNKT